MGGGEAIPQLVVPDHATLARVHDEHLARAQRTSLQNIARVDVKGADFGRQYKTVITGHVVACRSQAVAVERGAEDAAV